MTKKLAVDINKSVEIYFYTNITKNFKNLLCEQFQLNESGTSVQVGE